jgi:hypothetical protein
MAGENSLFAAYGFGGTPAIPGAAASFRVMTMSYGLEMYYVETEGRAQRTIYFQHVVEDNFTVKLGFNGWQQYNDAATWFSAYSIFATDPTNSTVNPMAVIIPFLNFAGIGIPHTGVTYGDAMVELMYIMEVSFVGTSGTLTPALDQTQAPANAQALNFYPAGLQQAGSTASSTEAILYDQSPSLNPTNQGAQKSTPVKPGS